MMQEGIVALPNVLQDKPALWKIFALFFEIPLCSLTSGKKNFLNGAFVFYILTEFLDYCV